MLKKITFLFLVFTLGLSSYAQQFASAREFWVSCFGMNKDIDIQADSTLQEFWVLVSSKKGCTGTIKNISTGYTKSFTVQADSVQKVYIPYDQVYNHSDIDSVFISNRSVIVTTSDSASVYLGNYQNSTYDATAVFPLKTLGIKYRVVLSNHPTNLYKDLPVYKTHPDSLDVIDHYIDSFYYDNTGAINVIATENNTTIKFNLTDTIVSAVDTYYPHIDYYKTLNKGEVLNIVGLKLLGSSFESTNCHKIAVFSGNYCAQMPYNCKSCDLLVEQMPPVNTWGQEFLVRSTLNRPNDSRIYITANYDNTIVHITKNSTTFDATINIGEYLDIDSYSTGTYIYAEKPVSVTQYAMGTEFAGVGDPMMMWINSNEQMLKEAIFAAPITKYVKFQIIQIFVNTADKWNTSFDGANIGHLFTPFAPNTQYSVARIQITPTTHKLINPSGFLAYVYGYDNGGNWTQESYGYSLNDVFHNTQDFYSITKNNSSESVLSYQTTITDNIYNVNDSIQIDRITLSEFDSISWLVNNKHYKTVPADNNDTTFSWKLPASTLSDGLNTVAMLVHRSCMVDSIVSNIWLRAASHNLISNDTNICRGDSVNLHTNTSINNAKFVWATKTETLSDSTNSIKVAPSTNTQYYVYAKYGNYISILDSVQVQVLQPTYTSINDTITSCTQYNFGGTLLNATGIYSDTLINQVGCDSIINLHLTVIPIQTKIDINICEPKTYIFGGQNLSIGGIYTDTLRSHLGCDSIITLDLTFSHIETIINDSICPGSTYNFNGQTIYNAGIYHHSISTANGCDSLITLNLDNKISFIYNVNKTICAGTSFQFGNQTISTTGIYTEHFTTSKACDSTVILQVHVNLPDTSYIEQTILQGGTFSFNNKLLTAVGMYTDTLININACDSIIILKLNITQPELTIEIPQGFSPNGDGVNDLFVIKNIDNYPNNHILIFNRWGNKLFEAKPYLNNWDGSSQINSSDTGNIPPNGTYYYILELGDGSKARKGWLWIER